VSAGTERGLPIPEWVERVYALSAEGQIDGAIDLVLDELDELLYARNAACCDEILAAVDVDRLPIEVMLAFLMETHRARHAMPRRVAFFARVERRLTELAPDRVERILPGLR